MTDDSRVVVVMGMHRAGTSFVSRILHEWGVCMGEGLGKPDPANPEGEWENPEFVQMNNALLSARGASWNYPVRVSNPRPSEIDDIKLLIRKWSSRYPNPFWGWKDNRTAFTFDCYKRYLNNPMIVVVHRNFGNIVRSLFRTHSRQFEEDTRNFEYFEYLTKLYYKEIDRTTEGMNRIDVNYEDLKRNKFYNSDLNHGKALLPAC